MKNWNFQKKLIVIFLIIGLVPLLIIAITSYKNAQNGLRSSAYDKLNALKETKHRQIESFIEELQKQVSYLAKMKESQRSFLLGKAYLDSLKIPSEESINIHLDSYQNIWEQLSPHFLLAQNTYKYYDIFLITNETGTVFYSNTKESDLGKNLQYSSLKNSGLADVWRRARKLNENQFAISDIAPYEPSGGAPAAFMATPLVFENKTIGIIAIQIPIDLINPMMNEATGLGLTGETYLMGADSLRRCGSRFHPEKNSVTNSFKSGRSADLISAAISNALNGKSQTQIIQRNGQNYLSSSKPIKIDQSTWVLLAEVSEKEALSVLDLILRNTLILIIVASLIILSIAIKVSRSIAIPLKEMASLAQTIAQGDLRRTSTIQQEDEVGILARAINTMISNLRAIVGSIAENSQVVATSSEELSAVSTQLVGSSENMSKKSSTVAQATYKLSQNISFFATSSEEMSANAQEVSKAAIETTNSISFINSSIGEINQSINEIAQDSSNAQKISNQATESSQYVNEAMKTLEQSANEIGNVTLMIKKIADQTNLLALNATIEAASAGEAGKGFAVVANEIKELASQSAKAAENISQKITSVQGDTQKAVKAIGIISNIIEEVGASVERIAKSVEEQSNSLQHIQENLHQGNSNVSNIANGINEIAQATVSLSENAADSSEDSQKITLEITEVKEESQTINGGAEQINQSASELAKMSVKLKEIVNQFQISSMDT